MTQLGMGVAALNKTVEWVAFISRAIADDRACSRACFRARTKKA
jgi:hypothetical protein